MGAEDQQRQAARQNPALTVTLEPRPGDANISGVTIALPRSEFLDQDHIKDVCTRVQFAADNCPAGSVYGQVSVTTPILDEPLTGNVYLRSSSNTLPDLVLDLHGPPSRPIRFQSAGKTDSIKGGIRNTFSLVPDVPITKVTVALAGGKKSLLSNSRNVCRQDLPRESRLQSPQRAHLHRQAPPESGGLLGQEGQAQASRQGPGGRAMRAGARSRRRTARRALAAFAVLACVAPAAASALTERPRLGDGLAARQKRRRHRRRRNGRARRRLPGRRRTATRSPTALATSFAGGDGPRRLRGASTSPPRFPAAGRPRTSTSRSSPAPTAPTPDGVPYQLFSTDLSRGLLLNGTHCRAEEGLCPISNPPLPGTDAPAGYQNYYLASGARLRGPDRGRRRRAQLRRPG